MFVDVTVIEPGVSKKKVKSKKVKEVDFSKLSSVTMHHNLEDTKWENCTTTMKELAPTIINVFKIPTAVYTIEKHITHNYVFKPCTDETDIKVNVTAPGSPVRLIEVALLLA